MFHLPFKAKKFPKGFPKSGTIRCSWADLLRATVSLAGSTTGMPTLSRPSSAGIALEHIWRVSMIWANLTANPVVGPLAPSTSYRGLDPSEKGAVSFFLGQVSAKLVSELLFAAPIFARVDEALLVAGEPITGRRADFYGWGPSVGSFSIEAKGRSGAFHATTLANAKAQAAFLPAVVGGGPHRAVGHLSYFSHRKWNTQIADPPVRRRDGGPTVEALLFAYYRPLYELVESRRSGTFVAADGASYAMADFPEVDIRIGLRSSLYELMSVELSPQEQGSRLRARLPKGDAESPTTALAEVARSELGVNALRFADEDFAPPTSTGSDGVILQIGNRWRPEVMRLEPEVRALESTE